MRDYHPLDTRHKANKAAAPHQNGKPWRNVVEPPAPPGVRPGPIRDDTMTEWRKREKIGQEAENAALQNTPLGANLFGPALLYYRIRAALIGERARGHSQIRIAAQVIVAFCLYFLIFHLSNELDALQVIFGSADMQQFD